MYNTCLTLETVSSIPGCICVLLQTDLDFPHLEVQLFHYLLKCIIFKNSHNMVVLLIWIA